MTQTFARAATLLLGNPLIVAVCIVTGLIAAASDYVTEGAMSSLVVSGNGSADALDAISTFSQIVIFVVTLAISLIQMAFVTGMAGAAWRTGRASLGDGWAALIHRFAPLGGAVVLLLVMGICAAVLAPITFAVTLVVYAVFFIYTIAAVVIGQRAPIAGIIESASLALSNLGPTAGVVAIVAIIALVGGFLGNLVGRLSEDAGWLVTGLLQQITVAYATLVVAGEYLSLASSRPSSGS